MTEKDDIIENHTSGKKPRRVPKNPAKIEHSFEIIGSGDNEKAILRAFDQEFIKMTKKRIEASPPSFKFKPARFDEKWAEVATFHNDLTDILGLMTGYFQHAGYIRINNSFGNESILEYYTSSNTEKIGSVFARFSLPKWHHNMLGWTNDRINKHIRDLMESYYQLTIVPLEDWEKPMDKGLLIPFAKNYRQIPESANKDDDYHVFRLDYDRKNNKAMCSYQDSMTYSTGCQNEINALISDWRGRK